MKIETDECRKCGASAEYFHPEIGSLCERHAEIEKDMESRRANNLSIKPERRSSSELAPLSWIDVLTTSSAAAKDQADELPYKSPAWCHWMGAHYACRVLLNWYRRQPEST